MSKCLKAPALRRVSINHASVTSVLTKLNNFSHLNKNLERDTKARGGGRFPSFFSKHFVKQKIGMA